MTEREAREAIRGRLKFWNDSHIRAVRFLEAVHDAADVIRESPECSSCYGTGKGDRPYATCRDCGGVGHFVLGAPSEREDVMTAAIAKVKREKDY